jgi:putative flavoprotein involved in K+ transport
MSSPAQASEHLAEADIDHATETAQAWLAAFEDAMAREDAAAAAELFCATSYWRDLVAFTWNIKTVENPSGVEAMLEETLAHVGPSSFMLTEPAEEEDGITTAWFTFETEVGRGEGVVRLRDGGAWTFLTALTELKGHEEPQGRDRPLGAEQVADPDRKTWTELREEELETLGYSEQPHTVIIGGGQGGIALGARLLLAQPVQGARAARPRLVRPPPVHQVPRQLAGVLSEGQARRLAGDVHPGDGAELLVEDRGHQCTVRRGRRVLGGRGQP